MQTVRIEGYNIGKQIGSGGMADVYDATEHGLGNPVAVKFIKAAFAEEADYVERFLREARICAKMNHPNIVKVHEIPADASSRPYIVMELLHGQTLRQRMAMGTMPPAEVVSIASQILSALAYAHQWKVVHRDIKPANIFLCDGGAVKVMDFGIARATFEKRLTQTGVWMGTPEYMSPEQSGGKADARSDLYSLGIMMYEMLTGSVPFRAPSAVGVLHKHANAPVPELPPSFSKGLRAAVARALAKDPAARFQSADEMLAALPLPKPPEPTYYEAPRAPKAPLTPIAIAVRGAVALVVAAAALAGFNAARRALTPLPINAATRLAVLSTIDDAVPAYCAAAATDDTSGLSRDFGGGALEQLQDLAAFNSRWALTTRARLISARAPKISRNLDKTIVVKRAEVWEQQVRQRGRDVDSPFNWDAKHLTNTYTLSNTSGAWKIIRIDKTF